MPQQSPLQAGERLHAADGSRGSNSTWPASPPARPCGRRRRSCPARPAAAARSGRRTHAGVPGGGRRGDLRRGQGRGHGVPRQATRSVIRTWRARRSRSSGSGSSAGSSASKAERQEADEFARPPPSSGPRRRGGRRRRKARATSCGLPVPKTIGTTPLPNSWPLLAQGVQVGQGQLARLDLLLDLGGLVVAQDGLAGRCGRRARAGCCGRAAAGRAA